MTPTLDAKGLPPGRRAEPLPDRLAYLLDHEYTPHAPAWNRLKNADAFPLDRAPGRSMVHDRTA